MDLINDLKNEAFSTLGDNDHSVYKEQLHLLL